MLRNTHQSNLVKVLQSIFPENPYFDLLTLSIYSSNDEVLIQCYDDIFITAVSESLPIHSKNVTVDLSAEKKSIVFTGSFDQILEKLTQSPPNLWRESVEICYVEKIKEMWKMAYTESSTAKNTTDDERLIISKIQDELMNAASIADVKRTINKIKPLETVLKSLDEMILDLVPQIHKKHVTISRIEKGYAFLCTHEGVFKALNEVLNLNQHASLTDNWGKANSQSRTLVHQLEELRTRISNLTEQQKQKIIYTIPEILQPIECDELKKCFPTSMQKFILITKIENTVTVAVKSKHMFILLRDKLALAPFNTKKTGSTFEFTLSYDELKNILAKNSQTKIENMHVNGIKNFYKKVSEQHPKLEGLKSLLEELGREVEFEHVEKILNKYAKVVESKEVSALKEKEVTSSTTQNIVQPAVKVSQVVATQFAKPVDKKEDVKTVPLVYLKQ